MHTNIQDIGYMESHFEDNSALDAYIQDSSQKAFIERSLMHCRTPREWAMLLIYKLYLEETLPWGIINSKNFIVTTAAFCVNLKAANYENLRKALARQYSRIVRR
ncbi:MAG: hypothetical protein MJZ32_11435 [Bacteroidaceae bacterium]|nr:hypothetical protein [Bacteroidaceae bacterium]